MKFNEIFKQDGLYVADGFAEGAAFKISDGTLYLVQYKNKNDLLPLESVYPVHKSLFEKDYRKVLTRQSLFPKIEPIIEELEEDCTTCIHNGNQQLYPSSCTGCLSEGFNSYKNYKKNEENI